MEDLQIVKRNVKKPSGSQILAMNSNQPMTKFSLPCQKVLADPSRAIKHGKAQVGRPMQPHWSDLTARRLTRA